ncbi:GNAT family N-acetyltransferase [Actinoplanes sp. NPDC051470]|uniref:GNAT family N-acetyltransferase n=1 Tax=unclassified Actinoplanes TaxID=2626549 RepID=UPI00344435C0
MFSVRRDDGLLLTDDRDAIDLDRVHRWLSTDAWWALDRTAEQTRGIVAASRPYGVYSDTGQVAFTRVVTDGLTFAYLADVFVDRAARGRGIGTWMTQQVCAHLDDQHIRTMVLATTDAHDVYARAGFSDVPPRRWMWRTQVTPPA